MQKMPLGTRSISSTGIAGIFTSIGPHELDDRGPGGAHQGRAAPGVRVNCLQPPAVRTGLRASAYPGELPASLPSAESVVGAFLYLLGDDSETLTGECFDLSGAD